MIKINPRVSHVSPLIDFDECKQGVSDCDDNAECMDTVGSFSCQCNIGFVGDGKTCDCE